MPAGVNHSHTMPIAAAIPIAPAVPIIMIDLLFIWWATRVFAGSPRQATIGLQTSAVVRRRTRSRHRTHPRQAGSRLRPDRWDQAAAGQPRQVRTELAGSRLLRS